MNIFAKDACNIGRQKEVDLLRGFTALNIIICHVGLYLGDSAKIGLYTFCDIFGSEFGAPIFMGLMGISMAFSRHQTPGEMFKRGVNLFILGYALSFYRSIIPMYIFGPVDEWATIEAFFIADILPFAGLTFMFIALLKKIKLPNLAIFAISIVMVIIDQFIMLPESVPWDSEVLTGLVNLFFPVGEWSCFPFLTWFFFPAFGLLFGEMLKHCSNKKKLYTILFPIGLAGVLYVYGTFHFLYPDYVNYYWGNNFYYMGLKNVLLTACFICFSLAFWFFADKILFSAARKFLSFLSRNLNAFYIVTWLVISVLMHLQAVYAWKFSVPETIGMMLLLIIVCAVFTQIWIKIKMHFIVNRKKGVER